MSISPAFLSNATPVILMCPPDHYKIIPPDPQHGHANDFAEDGYRLYLQDPNDFLKNAMRQWDSLRHAFEAAGARVVLVDPDPQAEDAVFTADPTLSLVLGNNLKPVTILSKFSNEPRQREVQMSLAKILEFSSDRDVTDAPYHSEGTGDNVYDPFRDCFWSGHVNEPGRKNASSGRSDIRSHDLLSKITGVPVISMGVVRPYFHIDTSMAPLPGGEIVVYKDGMTQEAYQNILDKGMKPFGLNPDQYIIPVSKEDALRYACNLRTIGNTVVIPECSPELQKRISDRGYTVVTAPLTYFMATGGAPHCLGNNLNETRIVNGYANNMMG